MTTTGFADYCRRKEEAALAATLAGFTTVSEEPFGADLLSVGNAWSRRLFDGDFHRSVGSPSPELPSIGLVVSPPPEALGAAQPDARPPSQTTLHLIHEGLSRVDVDAVLGGMGAGTHVDQVCSVWHPELVRLRLERGLPRHPAQILVTRSGNVPFERCLLFHEPSLRVVVVTSTGAAAQVRRRLRGSPWVQVVDAGEPLSLREALIGLRAAGIAIISAVGGRRVASTLLRDRLATDLYVATRQPDSTAAAVAFYDGPPLVRRRLLAKTGRGIEGDARFEHLVPPGTYASGLRLDGPPSVLR